MRPAFLANLKKLPPLTLILLAGCASFGSAPTTAYKIAVPARGLVLVLDGAGGSPEASQKIAAAVQACRFPLAVRTFDWTHGQGRGLDDMTDQANVATKARCLASQITWHRTNTPNMPLYVVAYSAGAAVALDATRELPADSIDRMVLLAPAVASDYDVRPALAASRRGVEVFSSARDRFYLGLGTNLLGTADGQRGAPAAGRVGFQPPALCPADAWLAGRLHPHPWTISMTASSNYGTHNGSLEPEFLRDYVLPLMLE